MEKKLTSGSVLKNVIVFSLPYLLSYFLQTLYGMADLFIIGQFDGVASTTAVSIGSQLMHMITVMLVGLAMGTTVSIAQAVGAGAHKRVLQSVGNTVVLFMIVAVALMALLLASVHPIVAVMSTPAEAVDGTVAYLRICFIGIPFITAYNIISSIFRGMGDSKNPMYFIAIACFANIVLDYVFIGACKMGPVALQDGLIQISFLIITIIVNQRGLNDAAAVGIVEKIISFLFLVPSSMLSTVSALGAQNIGANKPERAVQTLKYAIMIAFGFGLIASGVIQFMAEPIVALFTDAKTAGGAEVIYQGGQYLRGYIWDCVFAGIHFSFSGYFCACGKSGLSFLHNILAIVFIRVPGAYLMSALFSTTLLPMGLATAAGSLFSVVICVIAFMILRKKMYKNIIVISANRSYLPL